ncbi:hypothetical protein KY290_036893 [Solanum tuberosum]|uniref:Uncharacterized protein n=1 Tax=Solanum tuberosum TaxID=4113 RepID=A0ABQ7TVH4_SOLTU|nr:hypothetical protein KY290_036893 [Solanum tuberosum]
MKHSNYFLGVKIDFKRDKASITRVVFDITIRVQLKASMSWGNPFHLDDLFPSFGGGWVTNNVKPPLMRTEVIGEFLGGGVIGTDGVPKCHGIGTTKEYVINILNMSQMKVLILFEQGMAQIHPKTLGLPLAREWWLVALAFSLIREYARQVVNSPLLVRPQTTLSSLGFPGRIWMALMLDFFILRDSEGNVIEFPISIKIDIAESKGILPLMERAMEDVLNGPLVGNPVVVEEVNPIPLVYHPSMTSKAVLPSFHDAFPSSRERLIPPIHYVFRVFIHGDSPPKAARVSVEYLRPNPP